MTPFPHIFPPLPTQRQPLPTDIFWPHPTLYPFPDQFPTLTAFAPRRYQLVHEGTADAWEFGFVRDSRFVRMPSGTCGLPGVYESASLLQLPESLIVSLTNYRRCHQVVYSSTYNGVSQEHMPSLPPPHIPSKTPYTPLPEGMLRCGEKVLCCPCSETTSLLGKAWHYRKTRYVLAALLDAPPAMYETHKPCFVQPIHTCGPTCPKCLQISKPSGPKRLLRPAPP